jgi:uncharacterized protein (TIGR02147 family)
MEPLFSYLDYRTFLHDYYESRKKEHPYFSYRFIGKKIDLDPGYVVKILQGKLHLPDKYIDAICALCKFSAKESLFFRALINFNKAKSESQIKLNFEKLCSYKSLGKQRLEKFQYEYYTKWYYAAIRSLVGIYRFSGDYEALAAMLTPQISVREAKNAIRLLEKLKLIRKEPSGEYRPTDAFVTTGESWHTLAVKDFQRETIRLAGESLTRHDKEERDISTVTVAINKNDLAEAKEEIAAFRETILKLASDSSDPDGVYQLNVQLFPMAKARRDDHE